MFDNQIGTILFAFCFSIWILLNSIYMGIIIANREFVFEKILSSNNLNSGGKFILMIVVLPISIFTLIEHIGNCVLYYVSFVFKYIFALDQERVIKEHKEVIKNTQWYNRLG